MKGIILFISAALISITIRPAYAQLPATSTTAAPLAPAATQGEVQQLNQTKINHPEPNGQTQQSTPQFIPQFEALTDDHGQIGSYHPDGQVSTDGEPYFRNLGTNGRTCFTCHQPQDGWGLSQGDATNRFAADPTEPLFRLVDGATCPDDDVSTPAAQAQAYSLVTAKGLIRIPLPLQDSMQFHIVSVQDTNGSDCNTNPMTGLTGPKAGFLSFYRRPLPTANLQFLSNIMWDTREPTLTQQAADATTGHAQADQAPPAPQLTQIVAFEGCMFVATPDVCSQIPGQGHGTGAGLFASQQVDAPNGGIPPSNAGDLTMNGATGGAVNEAGFAATFTACINDPFGCNGQTFDPAIFHVFDGFSGGTADQQALFRGQQVFNTVQFQITGVPGLNDVQGKPSITGTCGTCHNNPGVGNHSSNLTVDIGVTAVDAPNGASSNLDLTGLPVITVMCDSGPLAGQTFTVTDLGVATVSGQCADVGKTKIPIIHGIAGRSPYFHNGGAPEITNLVNFYNTRFNIGLTAQQLNDLEVFLEAL